MDFHIVRFWDATADFQLLFFFFFSDLTQLEQGHGRARCRRCVLLDPGPDQKCESQKFSWSQRISITNGGGFISQRRQSYYTVRSERPWSLWHLLFSKLDARRRKVNDVTIGDLAISEDATAKLLRRRRRPPAILSVFFPLMVWYISISFFFPFSPPLSLSLFLPKYLSPYTEI